MFSLYELQIALMRLWIQSFAGPGLWLLSGHAPGYAERKAAADATRELDFIVRMHSAKQRHQA